MRILPVIVNDDSVDIANYNIKSKNLAKALKGCNTVVVFAATLGIVADKMIAAKSVTDMARTVVLDGVCTAAIESYCNEACAQIALKLKEQNLFLRPRFSPGYGDFDISYQKCMFELLNCRRIGLCLTDAFMLVPTKSVTAVIGISEKDDCAKNTCETCNKKDCNFKRGE